MIFSPDNRTTLETLLAGLQAGVPGEQVAPILNATMQAQMAQQEARQAKYQEMASNVANMAGQGLTYGAVGNYVDAMTPRAGIPGKFQQLMDSAYANPDIPAQLMDEVGPQTPGYVQQPGGGFEMQAPPPISPEIQSQLQSPLYTQNPANTGIYNMNPGASQGNLMTAPGQARYAATQAAIANMPTANPTDADLMGQVNAQINKLKASGMAPEQIAQLIQTDAQVSGVIMDNFNEFTMTQPDIVSLLAPQAGI